MTTDSRESNRRYWHFMTVVTLESSHGSNRRWIVWWVVRSDYHSVIAGRRWQTRFLNVLKTGFPAAPAATLHGHAINCVPRSPFSRMGRTPETGSFTPGWMAWISARYALVRILMHAVKTEPARFWRVFRVVCCLFCRFPVRNALRASQAVLITDVVVVNVKKHFPW